MDYKDTKAHIFQFPKYDNLKKRWLAAIALVGLCLPSKDQHNSQYSG